MNRFEHQGDSLVSASSQWRLPRYVWAPVLICAVLILWALTYPFDFQTHAVNPWLSGRRLSKLDTLGNVVLFMPYGLCAGWFASLLVRRTSWALLLAVLDVALLSLLGETLQVFLPLRESSVVDLVANTLGGAAGVMAGVALGPRLTAAWAVAGAWLRTRRAARTALAIVTLVLLVKLAPLDFSPQTFYLRQSLTRTLEAGPPLSATITHMRSAAPDRATAVLAARELLALAANLALMAAAAAALARAARESLRRLGDFSSPGFIAGTFALLLALGTELLQFALRSRTMDATDAVAGIAGVALGLLGEALLWRWLHAPPIERREIWNAPDEAVAPGDPFPRRRHYLLAAAFWTLLAVYGSLVPVQYRPLSWEDGIARFRNVPYLNVNVHARQDLVANILLFVPLGYLWLGAIDARRARRWPALLAAPLLLALLAALAVAVELTQVWFPPRTVSQNDILAEIAGALAGILLWLLVGRRTDTWLRRFFGDGSAHGRRVWLVRLLQAYLVGFVLFALLPLDVITAPAELQQKWTRGQIVLAPFSYQYENWFFMLWHLTTDAAFFAPIGALIWLRRRSLLAVALLSLMLAAAVEVGQLAIFSRFTDTTDLFTGAGGALLGALLARHALHRHESGLLLDRRVRLAAAAPLALAYVLLLLVVFWTPMVLAPAHHFATRWWGMFDWPFVKYYWSSEHRALLNVMRQVLLFVVLGGILRWGLAGNLSRRAGRALVLLGVLLLSLLIQTGKARLAGHTPDVTSLVLNALGALLGWGILGKLMGEQTGPSPSLTSVERRHRISR